MLGSFGLKQRSSGGPALTFRFGKKVHIVSYIGWAGVCLCAGA